MVAPITTVIFLLATNGKLGQHNQDRITKDRFYRSEDLGYSIWKNNSPIDVGRE